jgi:NAD(P)H-hydrate epimerase
MLADTAVIRLDGESTRALIPRRDPDGHKGSFGRVLCVAGSLDYAGAALLCGLSAVRGGAGRVALAVPEALQAVFAGRVPETITIGLPAETAAALERIARLEDDAFVVGPGLAEEPPTYDLVVGVLESDGSPAVVDAGALNLLARSPERIANLGRPCVMTPHPGEFARLTGSPVGKSDGERLERCAEAARRFGQVVVLKGARTVIAAPDGRVAVAPFANAALATAGSGDVLSGLIGALLAQQMKPFDAACLGVYLHGRAGERLSWRMGDAGTAASDIAHELPATRHELAQHSA